MGRDWKAFCKAIEKDPKKFAEAVVYYLDPPKYAVDRMVKFDFLCGWPSCWAFRVDVCFKCQRGICDEHSLMYHGPETKLEWYVCIGCAADNKKEDILKEIAEQDEQFWLEDQEAEEEKVDG